PLLERVLAGDIDHGDVTVDLDEIVDRALRYLAPLRTLRVALAGELVRGDLVEINRQRLSDANLRSRDLAEQGVFARPPTVIVQRLYPPQVGLAWAGREFVDMTVRIAERPRPLYRRIIAMLGGLPIVLGEEA